MARGGFLRMAALRVLVFIIEHPRLDLFLRHQVYRFPGLAGRVRAAVSQSRRSHWQAVPVPLSDETELTDSAREVLRDLRRAIERPRTP